MFITWIKCRFSNLKHWIDFDESVTLHRWTAYSIILFTAIHVNAHYVNMFAVEYQLTQARLGSAWEIHYMQYAGVTGHLMLLVLFLMATSSVKSVRAKKFEVFWYTHHLFMLFFVCLFFHAQGCFVRSADTKECKGYNSNYVTIPVFLYYLSERCFRIYRSFLPTTVEQFILHPGKTIELRFNKPSLVYKAGQYVLINIPSISRFQWHPFTITSSPDEAFTSIHMRIVGDWTENVASYLSLNQTQLDQFVVRVDGPFGTVSEDWKNYPISILIGAGIGVTPASSILKTVRHEMMINSKMPLTKLYFIWINRDPESFEWFHDLLSDLEESTTGIFYVKNRHDTFQVSQLEIHTYLTAKTQTFERIRDLSLRKNDRIDPITKLLTPLSFGRPNWTQIFKKIHHENRNRMMGDSLEIGVFYCGTLN